MEFIREDCIYARQSVDRKDSILLFRRYPPLLYNPSYPGLRGKARGRAMTSAAAHTGKARQRRPEAYSPMLMSSTARGGWIKASSYRQTHWISWLICPSATPSMVSLS